MDAVIFELQLDVGFFAKNSQFLLQAIEYQFGT